MVPPAETYDNMLN